jgi:hypothetical protein
MSNNTIVEARIINIPTGTTEQDITFIKSHFSNPVISFTLEIPSGSHVAGTIGQVNVFARNLNETGVTIETSHETTGSLHLHVISKETYI